MRAFYGEWGERPNILLRVLASGTTTSSSNLESPLSQRRKENHSETQTLIRWKQTTVTGNVDGARVLWKAAMFYLEFTFSRKYFHWSPLGINVIETERRKY